MKSLFFAVLLSMSSFFISYGHAAGPRYSCAISEIESVLKNKNLNAEVLFSGNIQSVLMTQDGYLVTTDKCEFKVDIEYTQTDENRPCPVFKAIVKNIQCH